MPIFIKVLNTLYFKANLLTLGSWFIIPECLILRILITQTPFRKDLWK